MFCELSPPRCKIINPKIVDLPAGLAETKDGIQLFKLSSEDLLLLEAHLCPIVGVPACEVHPPPVTGQVSSDPLFDGFRDPVAFLIFYK